MKTKRFALAIVLMLFAIVSSTFDLMAGPVAQAQGSTYYVAEDGSDADGDGSLSDPWATITHALDNVPDQISSAEAPRFICGASALEIW